MPMNGTPPPSAHQGWSGDRLLRRLMTRWGQGPYCTTARASGTPARNYRAGPGLLLAQGWQSHLAEPRPLRRPRGQRQRYRRGCQGLIKEIAKGLGIDDNLCFAAYEDPWYYSWRERRLPSNVDPQIKSDDPRERERLTKVFRQDRQCRGSGFTLGFDQVDGSWRSGRWFLREEHCFLMPGDSPLGFRLPLDSTPWSLPEDHLPLWSPIQAPPPRRRSPRKKEPPGKSSEAKPPKAQISAKDIVRTALSVEPWRGICAYSCRPSVIMRHFLN